MEGELFQGGVLMHSYLRAVGFSRITKRSSIRQIITDVVETYDEKTVIENYPDGMFAEFSKNYGCDCGITVCGQYDENNVFYPDYYFPFFSRNRHYNTGECCDRKTCRQRIFLQVPVTI